MIVSNVVDRRHGWIGAWEVEPFDFAALTPADAGRVVIYQDSAGRREAGTLMHWNDCRLWARFHKGVTAAACAPADIIGFGLRRLGWNPLPGTTTQEPPP